jgi:hypothetical protein
MLMLLCLLCRSVVRRHLTTVGDNHVHDRFVRRSRLCILNLAEYVHSFNNVAEDNMFVVKMLVQQNGNDVSKTITFLYLQTFYRQSTISTYRCRLGANEEL